MDTAEPGGERPAPGKEAAPPASIAHVPNGVQDPALGPTHSPLTWRAQEAQQPLLLKQKTDDRKTDCPLAVRAQGKCKSAEGKAGQLH